MTFLSLTAAALLLLSADLVSTVDPVADDSPADIEQAEAEPSADPEMEPAAEPEVEPTAEPEAEATAEPEATEDLAIDAPSGDTGAAAPAEEDLIAAAASGLIAQIEDDNNPGGDLRLVSIKTTGCSTLITASGPSGDDINGEVDAMADGAGDAAAKEPAAPGRTWTIDWAVPGSLAPGDTFVFIDVAPVKIAIVGDASKADQGAKLTALFDAMFETQLDCSTQF